MILTEEHLTVIGIGIAIAIPTVGGIIATHRFYRKKITDISETQSVEKERVDNMEREFSKEIKDLKDDVSELKTNNREDHRIVFERLGVIGENVAELKGYLMGKKEQT